VKKEPEKWVVRPIQGMIKSNRSEKATGICGKNATFPEIGFLPVQRGAGKMRL
jgi:hypothetical protein